MFPVIGFARGKEPTLARSGSIPPAASSLTSMKTSLRKLVWLGVLTISTATVAVVSDDSQVVIDGPGGRFPTFDTVEDIVDRWVENGRQFINRNGQTCTY